MKTPDEISKRAPVERLRGTPDGIPTNTFDRIPGGSPGGMFKENANAIPEGFHVKFPEELPGEVPG